MVFLFDFLSLRDIFIAIKIHYNMLVFQHLWKAYTLPVLRLLPS